jgi:hypothetical protein
MKPTVTITELQDHTHFQLVDEYEHHEIFKFLFPYYYKKRSWIIYFHFLLSFFALVYWISFGIRSGYTLSTWVVISCWSVITMVVIVLPLHEIVRPGLYRLLGARLNRFYFSFKKIYALSFSYEFVFSAQQVSFAVLIPFIFLNMVIFTASAACESTRFYFLAILVINIGAGSKEFAILNYFWIKRNKKLYSYNTPSGQCYIFEEISE